MATFSSVACDVDVMGARRVYAYYALSCVLKTVIAKFNYYVW